MEKEFVPYELAVKLKELGFDEPCLGFYDGKGDSKLYFNNLRDASGDFIPFVKSERLTWFGTPTFSQAFRWFRENHPYRFYILPCSQHKKYLFEITLPSSIFYTISENEAYNTYEDAELACLKKLIEIVELKSE